MNEGPTRESIGEAVATAKKELRRLDGLYRNPSEIKGSYCHKYFKENISVNMTQASLDKLLKQTEKLRPAAADELSDFNACIDQLRAALPPGNAEPEPDTYNYPQFQLSKTVTHFDFEPNSIKLKKKKKLKCTIC